MGKTKTVAPKEKPLRSALAPVAVCCAAFPGALATHGIWGGDQVMVSLIGASAVVVTGITHSTWSKRHRSTRAMATVFAGSVSGWTALATAAPAGPLDHVLLNSWGLGTIVLSVSWWLQRSGLAVPHDNDRAAQAPDGLGTFARAVGSLTGARAKGSPKVEANEVSTTVQLKAGRTAADVQADASGIASALKVGSSDVSVVPVRGRADQVVLSVRPSDVLSVPQSWPGPSAPGSSVADAPLRIGVRADGTPVEVWLSGTDDDGSGNPRQVSHLLITGMSGSGKTHTTSTLFLDARSRSDVCVVVGDPAKFKQSFGDIEGIFSLVADGKEACSRLGRNLAAVVEYRAGLLGSLGFKQWEPRCFTEHGIPFLLVELEEATDVLSNSGEDWDEAVRKFRSVGAMLAVSLQAASYDNIPRKSRGGYKQRLAHGCMEDQDAKTALSSETLAAGADPTKWENNFAGCFYAETSGTPSDKWPMDARGYRMSKAERAEMVALGENGAVMDRGTYELLSAGIAPAPVAGLPPETASVYADQDGEPAALEEVRDGVDIARPIDLPDSGRLQLRPPVPQRMSAELAREELEGMVDGIESEGRDMLRPSDLFGLLEVTGFSRQWIYKQLSRLADEGRLAPVEGKDALYRIRPRAGAVTAANGYRF